MNKFKFNLLAIIGMMVAVATFAFTAAESVSDETYYFTVNANDEIDEFLGVDHNGESALIGMECDLKSPTVEICGAGLTAEQVDQDGPGTFKAKPEIEVGTPGVERIYKDPLAN